MNWQEEAGVRLELWGPVNENYCDTRQEIEETGSEKDQRRIRKTE